MKKTFKLTDLDCANCAAKMEAAMNRLDIIDRADVNFMSARLILEAPQDRFEEALDQAQKAISKIEESCKIQRRNDFKIDKNIKRQLIRILLAAALFVLGITLPISDWGGIALLLASYLIAGYDTIWSALRNITRGQLFDENFLMTVATLGAIALQDYKEAVFVMVFFLVGSTFEDYAVNKSRGSITSLMEIRPDYANLFKDGTAHQVDPHEVAIGDVILIKPGEKVPLDGTVLEGISSLDTSALTGESLPRDIEVGQTIMSGCINLTGPLKVQVESAFEDSTVSKILDMVENAGSKKAKMEKFITRFARYYTPIVVFSALALAILPPLILPGQEFSQWIQRALIFLVVSCPCALVISVPLAFFGGIGGASKNGILVKGSNYLEALANVETVIFDKTGTLTTGAFRVSSLHGASCSEGELLRIAALAESYSDHPISLSIGEAYGKPVDKSLVTDVSELAGKGVKAVIEGQAFYVGNARLMEMVGIHDLPSDDHAATLVHVASENQYYGYAAISDTVKPDAPTAVNALKSVGVKSTVMLTGDRQAVASNVAASVGLDTYHADLLPGDKVALAEKIIETKTGKGNIAFVGDGINDAPVLARADIGIAMGGLGSQAAIEAADVVIMDDQPSKLPTVMRLARRTLVIAKQNVVFALTVKAAVLALSTFGLASMWAAVFADVGVAVIAILNSMRTLGRG